MMSTAFSLRYCGRSFTSEQLQQIRHMIAASPDASRAAISREVCRRLDWRKPDGGLKEMSCRVALLRMHEDGLVTLPPPRNGNGNARRYTRRTSAAQPQPIQEFSLSQLGGMSTSTVIIIWAIRRCRALNYGTLLMPVGGCWPCWVTERAPGG